MEEGELMGIVRKMLKKGSQNSQLYALLIWESVVVSTYSLYKSKMNPKPLTWYIIIFKPLQQFNFIII